MFLCQEKTPTLKDIQGGREKSMHAQEMPFAYLQNPRSREKLIWIRKQLPIQAHATLGDQPPAFATRRN
jgi:hypothetical protein